MDETLSKILPLVQRPSRYVGGEVGAKIKDRSQVGLTFALAFPDVYDVGMSHLGLATVYHLLNARPDVACERVFAPWPDMEAELRAAGLSLTSLESGTALSRFDVIGFSLAYELTYTNLLAILDLGGVPLRAADRGQGHPIVIAGGVCAFNPEPMADFLDAVLLGDAEEAVHDMVDCLIAAKQGGASRQKTLEALADVEGVYVPSFFEKGDDGAARPLKPGPARVRRRITPELRFADAPHAPVVPYTRVVHDRLSIEVARGCTRGCRFCQAGIIYRPVRERHPSQVLALADQGLKATGFDQMSLLSLSTGDYSSLKGLLPALMDQAAEHRIAAGLPSLRADTLTPELMDQIKSVRKTGFTIAPEAATQRLREVINKGITESDVSRTIAAAFSAGWNLIKLYFMIGLPFETEADREAIGVMCRRLLKEARKRRGGARFNVSVSLFVPKAHTPFQWSEQMGIEASRRALAEVKASLAGSGKRGARGIRMKWSAPEISFLEGVMSRGDRALAGVIETAYKKGCRFDGWTEELRFDLWQEAFEEHGIEAEKYLAARGLDEPLPWDHLDVGVDKQFLTDEYTRATLGQATGDCRLGDCNQCGVCDFDHIAPVVHSDWRPPSTAASGRAAGPEPLTTRYRFQITKEGPARFLGHLEYADAVTRGLRRAGLPLHYSSGFHPLPKLSFSQALPLGVESVCEAIEVELVAPAPTAAEVIRRVNDQKIPGVQLLSGGPVGRRGKRKGGLDPVRAAYRLSLSGEALGQDKIDTFMRQDRVEVIRRSPKGEKVVDIRKGVISMRLVGARTAEIEIDLTEGRPPRIAEFLEAVFDLEGSAAARARMVKVWAELANEKP